MNFDLTHEQTAFRDVVRGFAEEVVAPQAAEADREERFPLEVARRMGELGLFGLPFPERYGGSDADAVTVCIAIEEIGRADQSAGITLSAAVGLAGAMVDRFGRDDQKERWLAPLARGETLGSFALTEPGGGSDAAAARTTARLEDDAWVIDGAKAFITNAGTPITAFHVVAAATEPGSGNAGLSTFVVPADAPGVSVDAPYRKMGWHASDTRGITFDGCRVPADALLGERGRGFPQCLEILTGARIGVAALAVGLGQACLDASVAYAGEREAFGRPIGANQAIQVKVADMRVAVETARLATYRAAWLKDQGRPHVAEASVAKLAASEAAVLCAREAVQIHGAYGFSEESPVARFYRDAKVLEIGEGTSEIHRLILARDLGLPLGLLMPAGRYTILGDDGRPVGTESFRCAPGPMGWRYFSDVDTTEHGRHHEVVDVAVDADWRVARVRIDTGAHELLLERHGDLLSGWRDGVALELAFGPDEHLDYLTPATNLITTRRLAGTVEIDVAFIEPFTLEPVRDRQRYERRDEEEVETAVGTFAATRWGYTSIDSGWSSDLWVAGDVVVRYDRIFELVDYEPGANGPRPVE